MLQLEDWQLWLVLTGFFLLWTWESLAPFFAQSRRVRHAARNLTIGGVNVLVVAAAFSGLTMATAALSASHGAGLLRMAEVPGVWRVLAALVVLDAWTYWWHRANHRIPILWRFHRMHHSDPNMDVSTATRFHLGEITLSWTLRLLLIPTVGLAVEDFVLYDAILLVVTQFHHANIGLPDNVDRLLRFILVSPNMHKVHHSRERVETDSNYASVLSLWDRLFETYREKTNYQTIHFGLDSFDGEERQSLRGLWLTPFVPSSHEPPVQRREQPLESGD